ncbi:hypothetical protein [Alloscardovia sp. HMSC034E08]|uniref:hypothetical protein n=1 Tax=Alloscardovia sp. HMSC034E08 TaxID=1739413 RepID=UPI0008B37791|nr:hypothetical protein [Alloscardovia sp. HMSC034E08]OFR00252.1 hypothetical protein HMPREF2909_03980 [Alloscardovia sp. HMSC034E08]
MAENQSSRRSGGKGSHGSQRSFGGGSRRSNSHGSRSQSGGRRFNDGKNSSRRGGQQRFNSDRRREDGEERRFDKKNSNGERRGSWRDDRRNNNRRDERNPRYNRSENAAEGRADSRSDRRKGFSNQRGNHQGRPSSANYDKPRKNSDGTLSFPSQNPYTDRRLGEPKMPKGLEWSMLSTDEKERLRGLSKEHAENIGLHILAAYALEEDDPQAAMEHAKWVARQASRVDVSRETLAFVAYRQGDYKLALREFRTAFRMNGYGDYLPFMADCERGLGNSQKAVDIALSDDAKYLQGEAKAELFLVYAGALADLDLFDKAVEIVHTIAHAQGVGGAYRMRAVQAEQNFLELAGRTQEAEKLNDLLDRLEAQYADNEEIDEDDVFVDNDLEVIDEDMLAGLGIDPREMADYLDSVHPDEPEESEPEETAEKEATDETENEE